MGGQTNNPLARFNIDCPSPLPLPAPGSRLLIRGSWFVVHGSNLKVRVQNRALYQITIALRACLAIQKHTRMHASVLPSLLCASNRCLCTPVHLYTACSMRHGTPARFLPLVIRFRKCKKKKYTDGQSLRTPVPPCLPSPHTNCIDCCAHASSKHSKLNFSFCLPAEG